MNRLVNAKSPYLLQHSKNPVHWHLWDETAFLEAQKQDKPIFLSIGYATCHWCHVMARESFENPEIADLLNRYFINIKIDREERPDIDHIYMQVAYLLSGHGGWPLTVIMTPQREPFFATTYIPPRSSFQRLGMIDLMPKIAQLWEQERDKLLKQAQELTLHLQHSTEEASTSTPLESQVHQKAFAFFQESYDSQNGGFGSAPKFPSPHNLRFLLRYAVSDSLPTSSSSQDNATHALNMFQTTLQKMRQGGIFDHLAFGFHRYSTDARWLLPHFEKMLYDQALLSLSYAEAYQHSGQAFYKESFQEIHDFLFREMRDAGGGFYSAIDADSQGEEGKYYLWSYSELQQCVPEDMDFLREHFSIQKEGNFYDELTKQKTGKNILHLKDFLSPEAQVYWQGIRLRLLEFREQRVAPSIDKKILTDWNGLMIAAIARSARLLLYKQGTEHENARQLGQNYLEVAEQATSFLLEKMYTNGQLYHRYYEGDVAIPAYLDDYSFLIWGLLELYQSSLKAYWLEIAIELSEIQNKSFWDETDGAFYFVAKEQRAGLLVARKEIYDGALPSGNSVALGNLFALSRLSQDETWEKQGLHLIQAFSANISQSPHAHTQFLLAFDMYSEYLNKSIDLGIIGHPKSPTLYPFLDLANQHYLPNSTLRIKAPAHATHLDSKAPASKSKDVDSQPHPVSAYLCHSKSCTVPSNQADEFDRQLRQLSKSLSYK